MPTVKATAPGTGVGSVRWISPPRPSAEGGWWAVLRFHPIVRSASG